MLFHREARRAGHDLPLDVGLGLLAAEGKHIDPLWPECQAYGFRHGMDHTL